MFCIPTGDCEIIVAAVSKSPCGVRRNTDIAELLINGRKFISASDLNVKHAFWNGAVSNLSGEKLLDIFGVKEFEISPPQYPTHYSPAEYDVVLDIMVHQNIRVSDIIVSDILDSQINYR
jgi:hypothetical protein